MRPYQGLAAYYDLLYQQAVGLDYGAQAHDLVQQVRARVPEARTLLDVACGTGAHLEHLRGEFRVEGLDLSRDMLRVARRRLPGVRLHAGDLADFDLGRRFDVVLCLFSSIAYTRTRARFRHAVRNLAHHVAPGGLLVLDGWIEPADWQAGHVEVKHAAAGDTVIVRLSRTSRRRGLAVMDWDFLLARGSRVQHFSERHEVGLFTRAEFVDALAAAGLEVDVDPAGNLGRGRYFGLKGARSAQLGQLRSAFAVSDGNGVDSAAGGSAPRGALGGGVG